MPGIARRSAPGSFLACGSSVFGLCFSSCFTPPRMTEALQTPQAYIDELPYWRDGTPIGSAPMTAMG
jgi:hypothetical protein